MQIEVIFQIAHTKFVTSKALNIQRLEYHKHGNVFEFAIYILVDKKQILNKYFIVGVVWGLKADKIEHE